MRGPFGAPGRGSPVVGTESSQDRNEPLPLLAEHLEQATWIEVAGAPGAQQQPVGLDFLRQRIVINHRSPSVSPCAGLRPVRLGPVMIVEVALRDDLERDLGGQEAGAAPAAREDPAEFDRVEFERRPA